VPAVYSVRALVPADGSEGGFDPTFTTMSAPAPSRGISYVGYGDPEVVDIIDVNSGEVYNANLPPSWEPLRDVLWEARGFAGTPSALTGAAGQVGVTFQYGRLVVARPDAGVVSIVTRALPEDGNWLDLPPVTVTNYTGAMAEALTEPVTVQRSPAGIRVLNRERRRGGGQTSPAPAVPAIARQVA